LIALLRFEMGWALDDDEIQDLVSAYGEEALDDRSAQSFKRAVFEDAIEVEETLRDLAVDKKIDHIRLIKRWKARQKQKEATEETP